MYGWDCILQPFDSLCAVDVQQNIKTVASLLQSGEGKYPVSQIPSEPDVRNEEDLPLKEIHEELDERGEIICTCHR